MSLPFHRPQLHRRPNLEGGDDYRCRFGGAPAGGETRATAAAAEAAGAVVRASYDAVAGTLACVSPPAVAGEGEALLEVSLNAQHFHAAYGFLYYGGVVLGAVSPSCGPAGGGTALLLSGAAAWSPSYHPLDGASARLLRLLRARLLRLLRARLAAPGGSALPG